MKMLRLLALLVGLVAAPALAQTATPQPGVSHEIAFAGIKSDDEQTDIYLLNVDTGEMRNLTNSEEANYAPAWSSDGKQLAFTAQSQNDNHQYDVLVMNLDTQETRVIAQTEPGQNTIFWSRDGAKIYYLTWEHIDIENQIGILNEVSADGSDHGRVMVLHPSGSVDLSPDGQQIVFQAQNGGLAIFNLKNGSIHPLTIPEPPDTCCLWDTLPEWSPDGTQIVFASHRNGIHIFTINSDGSNLRKLVQNAGLPHWLPDGSGIIFVASPEGEQNSGIYTARVGGSESRSLTETGLSYGNLIVSPDGTRIAFTVTEQTMNLGIVSLDGSNQHLLTHYEFQFIGYPAWRPVPGGSGE